MFDLAVFADVVVDRMAAPTGDRFSTSDWRCVGLFYPFIDFVVLEKNRAFRLLKTCTHSCCLFCSVESCCYSTAFSAITKICVFAAFFVSLEAIGCVVEVESPDFDLMGSCITIINICSSVFFVCEPFVRGCLEIRSPDCFSFALFKFGLHNFVCRVVWC